MSGGAFRPTSAGVLPAACASALLAVRLSLPRGPRAIEAAVPAAKLSGALAAGMTQTIAADPASTQAHNLEVIFDKGGCSGAAAGDSRIDPTASSTTF